MYLSTMNGIVLAQVSQPAPAAPEPMEVNLSAPETSANLAAPAADADVNADVNPDIQSRELARAYFSNGTENRSNCLPRPLHVSWDGWLNHGSSIVAQSSISGRYTERRISPDGLARLQQADAPNLKLLNGVFTAKRQTYLVRVLEAFTGSIPIAKPLSSASTGQFQIPAEDGVMDDLVAYTCNPHTGLIISLRAKSMQHQVKIKLASLDYIKPD